MVGCICSMRMCSLRGRTQGWNLILLYDVGKVKPRGYKLKYNLGVASEKMGGDTFGPSHQKGRDVTHLTTKRNSISLKYKSPKEGGGNS